MKKKFNTKRRKNKVNNIIKLIIIIFIIYLLFILLKNINLKINNELLVKTLSSNFHNDKIYNDLVKETSITSTYFLESNYFKVEQPKTIKEENNEKEVKEENPIIYIYNTHQTEEYKSNSFIPYTINPNVMMNNYIIEEIFENNNLSSLVEERSVKEQLNINGYTYSYSYIISKQFMESAKLANPSIKYFIDIHRDSQPKNITTIEIDNKSYAKLLFVVGLEHENYQANLNFAEELNNKLNEKYPNLSRGVLKKSGANVNGIYNQDVSPYVILLEVGGVDNEVDEVLNSLIAFSECFMEVISTHET